MKSRLIVTLFLISALSFQTASGTTCSEEFYCKPTKADESVWTRAEIEGCSAAFGGFPNLQTDTQSLASLHLEASMKYLLLASHFGAWKEERNGFRNYFNKLSDANFNDAVALVQQLSKRGGKLVNFNVTMESAEYEISEIEALTKALDIEKGLATETLKLIQSAGHGHHVPKPNARFPDGALAHYLAEEISERQADRVQDLAAHVNNLGDAIAKTKDLSSRSFILHLYDTQFMS